MIDAIKLLVIIYLFSYQVSLFIVIHGSRPQTSNRNLIIALMITNYGAFDANIHTLNRTNDFNLIINTINANDLITHSSKLLSVMYEIIGKLIFIHSTSQTKTYVNTVRNLTLCILLYVQCIVDVVWSLTMIITFEFFIKLCILMYLYEKINDILRFQSPSDHSTITIKTGSNDRPTTVK